MITQVVPPYDRTELPTVKLYRDSLNKYMSSTRPSFVSLEGVVDAMVVVEGLKKAGSNPTREKFIDAIESMHDFDAGPGTSMHLMYSPHPSSGVRSRLPHGCDWRKATAHQSLAIRREASINRDIATTDGYRIQGFGLYTKSTNPSR